MRGIFSIIFPFILQGQGCMQEEELIQLHTMLAQMKNEMRKEHQESKDGFKAYGQFGILSLHMPEGKFSLLERIRRLFKN